MKKRREEVRKRGRAEKEEKTWRLGVQSFGGKNFHGLQATACRHDELQTDIDGLLSDIGSLPMDIDGLPPDIGSFPLDIDGLPTDIGSLPLDIEA